MQPEGSAQQTSVAAPGKRGRSRTSKQPTAAPAAAAALVMQAPAAGTAEANDLHGVASEPAGPVAEQTEAPKKRKRRTASSLSELKQVCASQLCSHAFRQADSCQCTRLYCPTALEWPAMILIYLVCHSSAVTCLCIWQLQLWRVFAQRASQGDVLM